MPPETSPLEWVHASLRVDVRSELAGSSKSTSALAVRAEGKKGHTYTLAAISRIQCVWRTRIVGYYCSSNVRTYWRLANSSRGRCDAASLRDPSQDCKACPFCNFHVLRISLRWASLCAPDPTGSEVHEFKIELTGRRVKTEQNLARMSTAVSATTPNGLLGKALFYQAPECASGFVHLRPRTSPRGTLCLKFCRQTSGHRLATSPLMMYRAVRLMRCGYGAMACYFPRFCKATGSVQRVTHMARTNDFTAQSEAVRDLTNWYKAQSGRCDNGPRR
jgi:hypothetical protein